jgi:kynurenine formamidase
MNVERLPTYDELPETGDGARSAWGLFGADDNVGLLNLVTPEVTASAARLVQTGEVFPLDLPLDFLSPPLFGRSPLTVEIKQNRNWQGLDDVISGLNTHASSQWDAIGHVAYKADTFYNGATLGQVLGQRRNTMDHWADRGIATRGVLLDLQRAAERDGRPYDPGTAHAFSVDDLEYARIAGGITYRAGDVLLLRTGFLDWYRGLGESDRIASSDKLTFKACGLEHTEEMARYLWDTHAMAVASDCPAVEVWPVDHSPERFPFGMLHQVLLAQFGMGMGELWNLDPLAQWCESEGRHEVFLVSAPLNRPGGVGSPANAVAVV